MKLVDKSGGFWTNIIMRKMDPAIAFRQNYIPDENITRLFAEETMSAIKGSVKHKISVTHVAGKLVVARFNNGTYSTGILKRTSPDGTPFVPLNPLTLELRKAEGNNRGAAFILRATGKHIMDGLKILKLTTAPKGGKFAEIGWSGENAVIAVKQNEGFQETHATVKHKSKEDGRKNVTAITSVVPARPFIGISEELQNNLQQWWNRIAK